MRITCAFVLGVLAVTALAVTPAPAVIAYAPNGLPRPYPFDSPDELIRFDTDDPASFEIIGSMVVPEIGFGGMEFDRNGNLWAYASFYKATGGAASGLYSVNIQTGEATVQGTLSHQPLEDLAFNPVDNQMYGIRTQNLICRLYRVNLTTGATTLVGQFTGLSTHPHLQGFAIDSAGHYYVHDVDADKIYSGSGLELTELYTLPVDTNFSQGMGIDWSRGNQGYHAAVGYGEYPNYFATINPFAIDGSSYVVGPDFGPNEMYNGWGFPLVEPGDIAIVPDLTACTLLGDVDGNGLVDGDDIGAYLRAKLGQDPLPGDQPRCADYGTGTLEGDTALFVADLLNQ